LKFNDQRSFLFGRFSNVVSGSGGGGGGDMLSYFFISS
jgi:hypothetical protein